MGSEPRTALEPLRLRANRKVIETYCSICNLGFGLAEEVCQCPACHGYHHVACWQRTGRCPTGPDAAAMPPAAVPAGWEPPPAVPPAPSQPQAAPPQTTAPAFQPAPPPPPPPPAGLYPPQPIPPPAPGPPLPMGTPGPDERFCPACGRVIKQQALKCHFCNAILDYALASQEVPFHIRSDIDGTANTSLTMSIIGLIVCPPILAPMAISKGNQAIRLLEQYPAYEGQSSARGRARAGIIIGWIGIGLLALNLIVLVATISRS